MRRPSQTIPGRFEGWCWYETATSVVGRLQCFQSALARIRFLDLGGWGRRQLGGDYPSTVHRPSFFTMFWSCHRRFKSTFAGGVIALMGCKEVRWCGAECCSACWIWRATGRLEAAVRRLGLLFIAVACSRRHMMVSAPITPVRPEASHLPLCSLAHSPGWGVHKG